MRRYIAVLATVALFAGRVDAITNEPTGYGKAKFGMTLEEVKKIYPELEELNIVLGAHPVGGPHITRYVLHKQQPLGMAKPVDVELRFWKGNFWMYIVYFGENKTEDVIAALTKQYGPSKQADERYPRWDGEKVAVSAVLVKNNRWYDVSDRSYTKQAREWFAEVLRGGGKVPAGTPDAAKGSPTPGSTPAATHTSPTPATQS